MGSYNKYLDASLTEREWNLNAGFGDAVLIPLCININEARKQGWLIEWFNSMSTLLANVAGHKKMNKAAILKIKEELKYIRPKIPEMNLGNELQLTEMQKHNMKKVKEKLADIHESLVTELYQSGLLFPTNERNPKFAGLEIK